MLEVFRTDVDVQGAGRTDAGVHAVGQVAHLKIHKRTDLPPLQILRRLNELLPSGIAVLDLAEAPAGFHARHDAKSRAYFYQISTRKTALSKRFVWWVKEPLNVARACRKRQSPDPRPPRLHRPSAPSIHPSSFGDSNIVVVDLRQEVSTDDNLIVFRIEASHFLWKMVRRLAGTLVKIGIGEVTVEQFAALLKGKKNPRLDIAAWTAPASGLFLEGVRY